jgi:nucleotide-binding universal stress UspA family protein
MIPFRRILFPVDFSDPCLQAVPHVKEMVTRFNADLVVLKVFEFPPVGLIDAGYGGGVTPPVINAADIQAAEETRLSEFIQASFPGMKLRSVLKEGDPAKAITGMVQHEGIDLVMMPTRGQGAFRRLLLGSVTGKVLHDASCAVWTDAHEAIGGGKTRVPYQSIICAMGLTEESRAVLHAGAALAKAYGAKLHLVHSVETPPAAYEVDFGPFRKELMDAAENELQRLRAEAGVEASITIGSGAIAEVVRAEAEKQQADLVIAGRGHSQGTFSRVWSALYSIVREAPCPVISI